MVRRQPLYRNLGGALGLDVGPSWWRKAAVRVGEEVVGQDHQGPCISVLAPLRQVTTNGLA